MSIRRISLGKRGENIAVKFLKARDFIIIARNYRNKLGEIDIIAQDEETRVFIEVKTRSSEGFGLPEEAVSPAKQRQICRVAQGYLASTGLHDVPVRFDVVAITISEGKPLINHIVSAFDNSR